MLDQSLLLKNQTANSQTANSQTADDGSIQTTDLANANRFCRANFGKIKYAKGIGWRIWNGLTWQDAESEVVEIAKRVAVSITLEASQAAINGGKEEGAKLWRWAENSQSLSRLRAMIALSETDQRIRCNAQDFNKNNMLLATKNCVIDLKKMQVIKADQDDMISTSIDVAYDPSAQCPLFIKFLADVTDCDQDLIDYLQKAVGYSLTGTTDEQCLFFLFGHGRNGKSVFVKIISELLGGWHRRTSAETLMTQQRGGISNDVAALAQTRLVTVSEVGEGNRLDEGKIKDLTGGDTMTARFLHGEYFDFVPKFKLWMAGNHKPRITGTDDGIWRRIRLIPFAHQIPSENVDYHLVDKLRSEMPGILNWALSGCQKWQNEGLKSCGAIDAATAEYRSNSDVIGQWIEECCCINATALAMSKNLQLNYQNWCEENGYRAMSQMRLSQSLIERNLQKERTKNGVRWRGIGLLY